MNNTSQNSSGAVAVIGVTLAGIAVLAAGIGILRRMSDRKPQKPETSSSKAEKSATLHTFVPKSSGAVNPMFGVSKEYVDSLREKKSIFNINSGRLISAKHLVPISTEDEGGYEYVVTADKLPNGSYRIKKVTRQVNS